MMPFRLPHGFEIDGRISAVVISFGIRSLPLTHLLGQGELIHGLRYRFVGLLHSESNYPFDVPLYQ